MDWNGFQDDFYKRSFKNLRISLTNACNFSCSYCVAEGELNKKSTIVPLKTAQLVDLTQKLNDILQLQNIRLTGGEPLLFNELPLFIRELESLELPIKLTTNGYLLENFLTKHPNLSLSEINVSLDAIDEDVFFKMAKTKNVTKIIKGIDKATDLGIKVKLNCVVMKGMNESQILPLMQFAHERNITIRFLEVMVMGHLSDGKPHQIVTEREILDEIAKVYTFEKTSRKSAATANYWKTTAGQKFGIIANESSPFCSDCDRLRLDSFGNIFGCLSNANGINIVDKTETELKDLLQKAMQQKQIEKFKGSTLKMIDIGG